MMWLESFVTSRIDTVAIVDTDEHKESPTVSTVSAHALTKSIESKGTVATVSTVSTHPVKFKRWLVTRADGVTLERPSAAMTLTEAQTEYADCSMIEPIQSDCLQPLSIDEEAAIHAWLRSIGENDPINITNVLRRCVTSQSARNHFLSMAAGIDC
jgi:hypothetical protein